MVGQSRKLGRLHGSSAPFAQVLSASATTRSVGGDKNSARTAARPAEEDDLAQTAAEATRG